MGFLLRCDRCQKVMRDNVPIEELKNIAENEYKRVCNECHARVTELEKFYEKEKQAYWNKLNAAHDKAVKSLTQKVKELKETE